MRPACGRSNTRVSETSNWRKARSYTYPACISAGVDGDGNRWIHCQKKFFTAPGPSRSQIFFSFSGASPQRNPLSNASDSIPAFSSCRFAHSWPFSQTQIGNGAYAFVFQNAPPQSESQM